MWFLEHENFHLFTTFFLHIKIHSSKNLNNSFIRESYNILIINDTHLYFYLSDWQIQVMKIKAMLWDPVLIIQQVLALAMETMPQTQKQKQQKETSPRMFLFKRELQWLLIQKDSNQYEISKLNSSNLPSIVPQLVYIQVFITLMNRELSQGSSVLRKETESSHSSFDLL